VLGFYEVGELGQCDVRPGFDGLDQIAMKRRQPSSGRPTLTGRFERSGLAKPAHQLDDKAR
jgi:hypothetical protein